MTLEEILPECPVFKLMVTYRVLFKNLRVYSSSSQSCERCEKNDNTCEFYLNWLGSLPVTQLATYRDCGAGV